MDFWQGMGGMVCVSVLSADITGIIGWLNANGIIVYDMVHDDDPLEVTFTVKRRNMKRLRKIVEKRGGVLSVRRHNGAYYTVMGLLKRPVVLAGLLAILFAASYLPARIFFIRIEGNVNIPTNLILERAAECGIGFGADRKTVRSEKVKNALLESIPELKWAGVNTSGCVATISVRERTDAESSTAMKGVSSIVALRDGVITETTTTKGNVLCKVGQAVKEGQVLVSGYTDCGLSIRAEQAQGEIFAQTERDLKAIFPDNWVQKAKVTGTERKYSLIIGKNRINLYKDSGILDSSCDKMYLEKYITLPGGFQLPFAIATEVWTYYDSQPVSIDPLEALSELTAFAGNYLGQQMIAGRILDKTEQSQQCDGCYSFSGKYACNEMIGLTRYEEIITPYGKHD